MADSIAIDFPGYVALSVVIVYRRIDGAALVERTYQRLVANRFVRSGDAARFRCTDAMF